MGPLLGLWCETERIATEPPVAALLARMCGARDVLFGNTVSLRPEDLPGAESMAGLFLNTILLGLSIALDVIVHKRGYRPEPPRMAGTALPARPGRPSR